MYLGRVSPRTSARTSSETKENKNKHYQSKIESNAQPTGSVPKQRKTSVGNKDGAQAVCIDSNQSKYWAILKLNLSELD